MRIKFLTTAAMAGAMSLASIGHAANIDGRIGPGDDYGAPVTIDMNLSNMDGDDLGVVADGATIWREYVEEGAWVKKLDHLRGVMFAGGQIESVCGHRGLDDMFSVYIGLGDTAIGRAEFRLRDLLPARVSEDIINRKKRRGIEVVCRVDPGEQKISLSMKAVHDQAERAALKQQAAQQATSQKATLGDLLAEKLAAKESEQSSEE